MRYSIQNGTVGQVRAAGGIDVKEMVRIKTIFATLTVEQANRLIAQSCSVRKVDAIKVSIMPPVPVAAEPVYSPQDLSFAAGYERLRSISSPPLYGAGYNLAIIGTGIRETHEQICGRVVYSKNFTPSPMRDGFDHDTGVCSIALAIAPQANILNLKVINDNGEGTEEQAVEGIEECITLVEEGSEYAPQVINLSLGAPDTGESMTPLRAMCREAIKSGIWVMAATGNEGPNPGTILSPACEQYVAAVGSCGYDPFQVSHFSSRGPTVEGLTKPDVVLFGENIIMASSKSNTDTKANSGTSFSVPFASGMALLFHEGYQRNATPTQQIPGVYPELGIWIPIEDMINKYLQGVCVKPQGLSTGKDVDSGYGLPFGPLITQVLSPTAGIFNIVTQLLPVMMMGMMIPVIGKMGKIKKGGD